MNPMLRQLVVILVAFVAVAGCTTTTTGGGPAADPQEAVRTRVAAGLQYLQMGDPSEARRHFSRALSIDDDSAAAHNAMALLYNYERDAEKEEYHYRKALSADGDYAPALNNYGTLLYTQRRYEEALRKFERAANDPNYEGRASAFSNMGQSYMALDRPDDAKDAFVRALRLNGRSTHATLQLAKLYYQEGRHQMGWDYYKQYERRIGRQSAEGLWTGIQLAAALGLQDQQSSYELALQNLYPGTREHKLWQEWRSAQEGRQ